MTQTVRRTAAKFEDWMLDCYGRDNFERDKRESEERGFERGFERGVKHERKLAKEKLMQERKEIAVKLLKQNDSISKIADICKMTEDQVREIEKSLDR